ncbi:MAG: hypothetical protein ABI596_17405 [Pyrinomonadaceae bacterium]
MNLTTKSFVLAFVAVCVAVTVAPNSWAQQRVDPKAAEYLADKEPTLRQTNEPWKRLHMLIYLAPAALAANEAGKAQAYAEELLLLGTATRSQPGFGESNYGQATHVGSVVLGYLAVMNGEMKKAREYLLAAGGVPGSASLNSFGPDMRLAKELIEKGERDTALAYFDLCAKFWANDRGQIQQWRTIVTQGGMPEFGPNLGHVFEIWRFAK